MVEEKVFIHSGFLEEYFLPPFRADFYTPTILIQTNLSKISKEITLSRTSATYLIASVYNIEHI